MLSNALSAMANRIAFPEFGWEFNIDPTAIENLFGIEGFNVQWYGIILSLGIISGFLLFYHLAVKKEQIIADSVYNVTLLAVPIAIIGARFVYVATRWEHYKGTGFLNMINIRGGGIAIYGAIIFGLAVVLIYNKLKKTSALSMLDALAPAVMIGQVIGRWGNFVNAEAYGWSAGVENLPWRMELDYYVIDGVRNPAGVTCVHPTFLYESLWNALGLALILFLLYRKKKFNGEIFFAYMGWYGLGRAFIETLRADSLYIVGSLKFSVFVGIVCFIAAIIGEIVLWKKSKNEAEELAEYKSAFSAVAIAVSKEEDALAHENAASESATESDLPEEEPEEITEEDAETLAEQDLLDAEPEETAENEQPEEEQK
ncbi:MAG: prolipoprotein diacylglyceryl transferase [Clostridia bacterium]|nr:prolipoprotein diacylglyceryl transferase [Clostridia bacterium]